MFKLAATCLFLAALAYVLGEIELIPVEFGRTGLVILGMVGFVSFAIALVTQPDVPLEAPPFEPTDEEIEASEKQGPDSRHAG